MIRVRCSTVLLLIMSLVGAAQADEKQPPLTPSEQQWIQENHPGDDDWAKINTSNSYENEKHLNFIKICQKVQQVIPPASDLPSAEMIQSLKGCQAEKIYYRLTPDYTKARLCAYTTDDKEILSMIYANGYGVIANRDLALHFSCQERGNLRDLQLRLEDLVAYDVKGDDEFDVCDNPGTTPMADYCQGREDAIATEDHVARIAKLTAAWKPEEKVAFTKLQKAFDSFRDARVDVIAAIYADGTARSIFPNGERMRENEEFISILEKYEKGELPSYSSDQLKAFDDKLNEDYKATRQGNDAVIKGRKDTERAWIKYRDAWVAFGKIRYPQVTADSWKALLTKERISTLHDE